MFWEALTMLKIKTLGAMYLGSGLNNPRRNVRSGVRFMVVVRRQQ
jgi:hypothetical protein